MSAVRRLAVLGLALGGLLALGFAPPPQNAPPGPQAQRGAGSYRLSGPYTHDNLTIFLIHGADQLPNKNILTLDEALEQKKVIVHETRQVNELAIENLSPTHDVFVQAGDIVKGGQQDRLIAYDLLVPPHSGRLPIASFCVEHGRWSMRAGEDAARFGSAKGQAPTNELKLAARGSAMQQPSQQQVWDRVARAQMRLQANLKTSVKDAKSESSLQLSLEHKKLREAVDAYLKKLAPAAARKGDVIGYAAAINGTVNNADIYASSALFQKLWPKLLESSAVEAVAELKKDKKFKPVDAGAVQAFLADPEKGTRSEKSVTQRFRQVQKETGANVLFETIDRQQPGAAVRKSYLKK
jgi:hypothetical protein